MRTICPCVIQSSNCREAAVLFLTAAMRKLESRVINSGTSTAAALHVSLPLIEINFAFSETPLQLMQGRDPFFGRWLSFLFRRMFQGAAKDFCF